MKKSYDSKFKSRVALEWGAGPDRRCDHGKIPDSSESGSAVEKETDGGSFRDFPVQGQPERE